MVEHLRALVRGTESLDEGRFTAIASKAGSIAFGERGPTRFAAGAFRETLRRAKTYPLLLQHQDQKVIGLATFSESADGLMVDAELVLDVQDAKETHALMKRGALTDVSIGFTAEKSHREKQGNDDVRVIDEAKLAECSVVTWGADPGAKVMTVHAAGEEGSVFEEFSADLERMEGRTFSESNLSKLRAALSSLVDLVSKVDPGHIASIGRAAARMMKKSLVLMPKKAKAKYGQAQRNEALRRADMLAAGVAVEDLPLLNMDPPSYDPMTEVEPEHALLRSLNAFCSLPEESKRALFSEACRQYLVAIDEAEPVGDDADEGMGTDDSRDAADA